MKATRTKLPQFVSYLAYCLALAGNADAQDREAELIARGKDDIELVRFIRDRIIQKTKVRNQAGMQNYSDSYRPAGAKQKIALELIAVKGGEFVMGSHAGEKDAYPDEKPPNKVIISPFWIGKYEVSWGLFYPYVSKNWGDKRYEEDGTMRIEELIKSGPSVPFSPLDFGMGLDADLPAISMTQNSANKFCQWLSYQTGHFYRLPTEAEWEYACRAGTTGQYSCLPEKLEEYAVLDPEQIRTGYEKVGTKKPNPWGIHDMHGNVMEWCLDQYEPLLYSTRKSSDDEIVDPFVRPNRLYPRVVRGGSWYDPAKDCGSTSRFFSHPDWQLLDPRDTKSAWLLADAPWLGFRIVRPLEIPSAEEMHFIWNGGDPDFMKKER